MPAKKKASSKKGSQKKEKVAKPIEPVKTKKIKKKEPGLSDNLNSEENHAELVEAYFINNDIDPNELDLYYSKKIDVQ
jgi:hypothetical protein